MCTRKGMQLHRFTRSSCAHYWIYWFSSACALGLSHYTEPCMWHNYYIQFWQHLLNCIIYTIIICFNSPSLSTMSMRIISPPLLSIEANGGTLSGSWKVKVTTKYSKASSIRSSYISTSPAKRIGPPAVKFSVMGVVKKSILPSTIVRVIIIELKKPYSLLVLALANGLVVGRGVKSSGAIMGVRTSEISEASSTSLDTVTSTGMTPLPSSTTLSLSLSRKTRANKKLVRIA